MTKLSKDDLATVRAILDPLMVAMQDGLSDKEAARLLGAILPIISRVMPEDLQRQDQRVVRAKELFERTEPSTFIPIIGVAR